MQQTMKRIRRGVAGAVVALCATPALAQIGSFSDDESIIDPVVSALALPGGSGYSINARINTLYDSNILRQGDGLAPRPGQEKADFRISPTVNGEIGVPIGRQQLHFSGTLGRDFFLRNSELDRGRFRLQGSLALAAGNRCTANLQTLFSSRQALFSDVADLVPNVQETFSYGGSANCQSAVGLGFGGNIQQTQNRNGDVTRSAFDSNQLSYGLNLGYSLGAIGRFQLSGNINDVTYLNRPIFLPDGSQQNDGAKISSAEISFSRAAGARASVTVGLSYFKSNPDPTTVLQAVGVTQPPAPPGIIVAPVDRPSFSGLGYNAQISYRPSQRLTASLAARRNASASINVGAQAVISTSFAGDIDYALGSGLNLSSGISHSRREYQNPVIDVPDRLRRRQEDKVTRIYGGVAYSGFRLFNLGAQISYQDRTSDPVEFSFSSFAATLNLSMNFGR